jgi:hypothetical protein
MEPVEQAGLWTSLQDLLADMRHLARKEGVEWADVQRMAESHFEEEVLEEEEES